MHTYYIIVRRNTSPTGLASVPVNAHSPIAALMKLFPNGVNGDFVDIK